MRVQAAAAATATTDTSAGTTSASRNAFADSQTFLQLLVAQLRNQDPMNPMDNQAMVAQMAQLQTVEQLVKLSEAAEAQQQTDAVSQALSLVGRQVEYAVDAESTETGTVQGVRFSDGLPSLVVDGKEVLPGEVVAVMAA